MEAALTRKSAMFRLRTELLDRLKQLAARDNRSLNNYVETILMDVAFNTPNAATIAALKEAQSGKLRDVQPIDTSSVEAMIKSMGL